MTPSNDTRERLLRRARELDGGWDSARSARVQRMALQVHAARARRARTVGRVLVGATSAACVVLALLRVAASSPASAPGPGREPVASAGSSGAHAGSASILGTSTDDGVAVAVVAFDAGYTRD